MLSLSSSQNDSLQNMKELETGPEVIKDAIPNENRWARYLYPPFKSQVLTDFNVILPGFHEKE